MSRRRRSWALLATSVSALTAAVAAFGLYPDVRLIHIVILFAGGFGAGAGVVAEVMRRRLARDA